MFTGWKNAEVTCLKTIWLVECHGNDMKVLLAHTARHARSARLLKLRKKVTLGVGKLASWGRRCWTSPRSWHELTDILQVLVLTPS